MIDSGNCGANSSNVTWKLTSDGTLTISGTGKMADYGWEETPWYGLRLQVKKAIIKKRRDQHWKLCLLLVRKLDQRDDPE